jgi:outer membrane receptor protein involved in Fe transport
MGYIANATAPIQDLEPFGFSSNFLSQLTIQYIPAVGVSGRSGFGQSAPTADHEDTWSLSAGIRHVRGRHDLKAGFEARFKHSNNGTIANNMSFSFDQEMTQGPDPTTVAANIGIGAASFLLGAMTGTAGGSVASPKSAATLAPYYAIYGQDTFRASSRLTLNAGLRWKVWQPDTDRYNRLNAGLAYDTQIPSGEQRSRPTRSIPSLPCRDHNALFQMDCCSGLLQAEDGEIRSS